MRKRLPNILIALCMMLCLAPTAAFAESSTEKAAACNCEAPADDAVLQPDSETCVGQPESGLPRAQVEATPVLLSGEGEQPTNGTEEEIGTSDALIAAIANGGAVKLTEDISIASSLEVNSEVTLDLNGHSLQMTGSGSAIIVANGAKLTLKDSSPETTHKFRKDGHLLTLDENGSETVKGGVITGGTGTLNYKFTYGGCVNVHGVFAMEGGTIVGGQATYGGGVYSNGQFIMNGGTIKGCSSSASGQYAAIYIGGGEMLANDGMIEGTGALKGTIKTDAGKGGTTFSGHIKFYSPCIIEGGNFTGYAENWSGTIKGGTFSGTVSGGRIQGGNFVVRFDLNGGTPAEGEIYADQTIVFQNQVTQPVSPSKIGYAFDGWCIGDSDDKWDFENNAVSAPMTLKAKWTDAEKPTGKIAIGTNEWHELLSNITFELFFKDTQTVTISATDNSGEAVTIEYLLSDKALTEAELSGKAFTAYVDSFNIIPDNEYIIYAKLTDTTGNVSYICSNGAVLDATNPVISGIENGKTYSEAQTVTIDEKYIGTVSVNGAAITLDENNQFILSPASGEQKIVVVDKAGNTAEMTVTVNSGHAVDTGSKSPQTGDTSSLALWIALLFVSGGVTAGATIAIRKKKYDR